MRGLGDRASLPRCQLGLWEFEGEPPQSSEAIDLMIDAARIRQEQGDGRVEPSAASDVGRARPGPAVSDESI